MPATLAHLSGVFLFASARMLPVALLSPWLGARLAPGLAGALAVPLCAVLVLTPAVISAAAIPSSPPALLAGLLQEGILGLLLALVLSLPFYALEWAGAWMDRIAAEPLGRRALEGDGSGPLQQLHLWLAVVLFFAVGGHRLAIAALAESMQVLPLGAGPQAGVLQLAAAAPSFLAQAFTLALMVALPAALALLVSDVLLAVFARVLPALDVTLFAPPLRFAWVVVVVLMALPLWMGRLPEHFGAVLESLRGLFG